MSWSIAVLGAWLAAAAVCYVWVARIRGWVARRGLFDIPNARSSHDSARPRGGGLAIVLTASASGLLAVVLEPGAREPITVIVAAGLALGLIGWFDDIGSLSRGLRFVVHVLAATAVMQFALRFPAVPDDLPASLLLAVATLLWMVGLINAYNFMDGIDGIAGGTAVVAGGVWAALALAAGLPAHGLLAATVSGASLGFLAHNWSPARIFMGDVGSTYLGFMFAALPVAVAPAAPDLAIAGLLLMWPFVFDTAFTFMRRLRRGERVFDAHRSHLYQRLTIAGWTHAQVSTLYIGLTWLGAVAAATAMDGRRMALGWPLAVIPAAALVLYRVVRNAERRHGAPVTGTHA